MKTSESVRIDSPSGASPSLTLRPYTDRIVRFTYGDQPSDITDSLILEPGETDYTCGDRRLELADFTIEAGDDLELTIIDRKGDILLKDNGPVRYDAHDGDRAVEEQEYDILNRDRGTAYAYIIKREMNWERAFYGLGEKYGSLNLIGRETVNWNTDVLGVSPVHTAAQQAYHTNIPFYIGTDGTRYCGIYYRTSYRNAFDFGKYSRDLTFKAEGGMPDFFFFYGDSLGEIVRAYSSVTGRMPLPRREFIGFQQCRWSYKSRGEVLETAREFRRRGIPADVIYLDIDYMDHYKVFTHDPHSFADFKGMIDELHGMDFKLVVIIDPGVKAERGYALYDEGTEGDYFIKGSDGENYTGQVWPGDSVFPDFLRREVRRWWGEFIKEMADLGVDGIWNDMNEPADMSTQSKTIPNDCRQYTDGGEIRLLEETHNLYGLYHARAAYDALAERAARSESGERPFVLTRAASPGSQRYSALWTGDNTSLWEHMAASIPMLLNLGMSGFSFVGADIGGFVGDSEPELLIRWTQLGICYPFCRNHSAVNSLNQEPWAFGEETEIPVKKAIELRYSLISEFYQLFYQSSLWGDPIIRPMAYHYGGDGEILDMDDQFLIGEDILAAPVLKKGARHRMVYIPEGRWYNLEDDRVLEGGFHVVEAGLDCLPLFVREGAILLRDKGAEHLGGPSAAPEVHLYNGPDRERALYFDDGRSFAYRKGKYALLKAVSRKGELFFESLKGDYETGEFAVIRHGFHS